MANSMRAVTSKSYAYHVETSFVEVHDESIHDLYVPQAQLDNAKAEYLACIEDPLEGWAVQGATWKAAHSADEAINHLQAAMQRLWSHDTDIGNVQQHTAAFFTVSVYQYWPSVAGQTEDRVLCSQMRFARSSGTEKLAMDPALLRIREGPTLNKGLITFCSSMQARSEPSCRGMHVCKPCPVTAS